MASSSKKNIGRVFRASPALQGLLNKPEMRFNEAVKDFWAYAKENKLQDPNDGRTIVANQALKEVFGQDTIKLTQVMKLLRSHLT